MHETAFRLFGKLQEPDKDLGSLSFLPQLEKQLVFKKLIDYFEGNLEKNERFPYQTVADEFYLNLKGYELIDHQDTLSLLAYYEPKRILHKDEVLNEHISIKKNLYLMNLALSDIETKEIMPGYHGKMIHGETMTLAFWEVEKGATVPEHSHINEQIMHVLEGDFEFKVAGVTKTYGPGELVIIPPNIPHSGKALTPCKLMDIFSPVREAYK